MQVVSVDVDNIFAKLFGCHANVSRKIGKWGTDPSSARRALLYGEKIAKIGPVCPEKPNHHFCNHKCPKETVSRIYYLPWVQFYARDMLVSSEWVLWISPQVAVFSTKYRMLLKAKGARIAKSCFLLRNHRKFFSLRGSFDMSRLRTSCVDVVFVYYWSTL